MSFSKNHSQTRMNKGFQGVNFRGLTLRLPLAPGVYLFKKDEKVLYVGKAAILKKRVSSYFSQKNPKIKNLLSQANKIEYIKTDSVLEALVLEANLIKKYWPIYNVKEKDNRSFVYIIIPHFKNTDFPYPIIVRGQQLKKYPTDNFYIFGPYQSYTTVKKMLALVRRIFPYCTFPQSGRPCFYYQINLCPGACINKINKKDYQDIIKNIILFLEGKKKGLIKKIQKDYPEKIRLLNQIQDSFLITKDNLRGDVFPKTLKIEGYDISHFAGEGAYGSMVVFKNNEPIKSEYRIFKIKKAKPKDDVGALEEVISRRLRHKEWPLPNLFLIDGGRGQVNGVYEVLKKARVFIPVVGLSKGKDKKDELIFKGTSKNMENLIIASKSLLQRVRDEAHRFALKFSHKQVLKIKHFN